MDKFLISKGCRHTRYVDDFRIFCKSPKDANRALHDLSDYLFTAHRLSLQPGKTRIITVAEFKGAWLENPGFIERQHQAKKLEEYLELLRDALGYNFTEDDLGKDDKRDIALNTLDTLEELFNLCVAQRPLRLGLARHLLRQAGAMRTNRILRMVLRNIHRLAPVLRDVFVYLYRVKQSRSSHEVVSELENVARDSEIALLPFVHEWVVDALTGKYANIDNRLFSNILKLPPTSENLRPRAFEAIAQKRVEWVRQYKETWNGTASWDRRAIILAGSILPADERRSWCNLVDALGDPLDKAVSAYIRGTIQSS